MPAPVFDTIADLIVSRLKAGTYTNPYELKNVLRPNQRHSNIAPEPFLCIVQMLGLAPTGDNYEEEGSSPFYRMTATYHAETAVMQAEKDETPHDLVASYVVFDMAKAITVPNSSWQSWGGNALNSRWRPSIEVAENGSILTAGLQIDVDVCLSSIDPYTFRG